METSQIEFGAPSANAQDGSSPTGYSSLLVAAQNAALQTIPLPVLRIEELPTELNQFFAAALANRARLDFDTEPASFIVALARGRKGRT